MLNGCAYILTVDVGNTFIRFGLFAEDSAAAQECPLATCEITTPSSITADEARMRLVQVMGALNNGGFSNITLVTDGGGPSFNGAPAASGTNGG